MHMRFDGQIRDEIAKIIDPETFARPRINLYKSDYERAYAKADAIIAALALFATAAA